MGLSHSQLIHRRLHSKRLLPLFELIKIVCAITVAKLILLLILWKKKIEIYLE